jgi:peroxiredoxin Q/BCP
MTTKEILAQENHPAIDFTATTIDGKEFKLSNFRGKKIFLSFYRNGACALCNLRIREISQNQEAFDKADIQIVAVFESSVNDMKPYVGKQQLKFTLLSDPDGIIYEQYAVKNSEELVNHVIASGIAAEKLEEAAIAGFPLTKQDGANFHRIPAEILINERFEIVKIHHAEQLIDHLPNDELLDFGNI